MALIDNILNGTPRRQRKIKFGFLVNTGTNNDHYLQSFDRLKEFYTPLDAHNYLAPIGSGENVSDDLDDARTKFADDAKWVRSLDGKFGFKSKFYLVSYLTDSKGKITEMTKIQELF